jgi:Na+/H+ antiporter NhaC
MNKDYGPMLKAENRARIEGKVEGEKPAIAADEVEKLQPLDGIKHNALNAVIPVLVVIFGTIIGLLVTGWDSEVWNDEQAPFSRKLSHIIGNADSYMALLWASLSALSVAIVMSVSFTKMKIDEAIDSMLNGFKTMLPTIIILVLAWSLALITEHLHTADFITNLLGDSFPPILFPAITFLLAAGVAFSTGSSWGTMAILYPLMLPAVWQICQQTGMDYDQSLAIFHNVVSCVLAGSVLGDHCSPISDTTILSSLASSCNHISHVKTQMPYAITVGVVAVFIGTIPAAAGVSSLITFPVGLIILFLIIKYYGKEVAEEKKT